MNQAEADEGARGHAPEGAHAGVRAGSLAAASTAGSSDPHAVVEAEPRAQADAAEPPPLQGCFVTGTDTEIGKTAISAGLLHALGGGGLRVAGYKPVAAGAVWHAGAGGADEGHWHNDDVEALHAASTIELTRDEVCPCLFEEACAPHIAARLEGRRIDPKRLIDGAHRLMARCDALVVEGVGGFCVPLIENDSLTERPFDDEALSELGGGHVDWGADDLAVALGLPVILVVGLRLGCINHALLTAQAIADSGLRLAGWIGNRIDAQMPHAHENVETLTRLLMQRHGAPRLGLVERLAAPTPRGGRQGTGPARHHRGTGMDGVSVAGPKRPRGAPWLRSQAGRAVNARRTAARGSDDRSCR